MPNANLYLSDPLIKIEGQPASPELLKDLLQMTVEEVYICQQCLLW